MTAVQEITRKDLEELRRKAGLYDKSLSTPAETQEAKIARLEAALREEIVKGREAKTEAGAQKEVNIDNRYQIDAYLEHLPDFMRIKSEWIDYMVQWTGSLFSAHKELHRVNTSWILYAIVAAVILAGLYVFNNNPNAVRSFDLWASSTTGAAEILLTLGVAAFLVYTFVYKKRR